MNLKKFRFIDCLGIDDDRLFKFHPVLALFHRGSYDDISNIIKDTRGRDLSLTETWFPIQHYPPVNRSIYIGANACFKIALKRGDIDIIGLAIQVIESIDVDPAQEYNCTAVNDPHEPCEHDCRSIHTKKINYKRKFFTYGLKFQNMELIKFAFTEGYHIETKNIQR